MAYLGIQPSAPEQQQIGYFDIAEGCFRLTQPMHSSFLDQDCSSALAQLLDGAHYGTLGIHAEQRKTLLDRLLAYYTHHLPELGNIRSHSVLTTVWLDE
jgi:DNA repair protein RecO (recombination protein O)